MSRLTPEQQASLSRPRGEDWRGRSAPPARLEDWLPSSSVLLTGLVVVGLGALAWYYLGPDLRRYLKIRSM